MASEGMELLADGAFHLSNKSVNISVIFLIHLINNYFRKKQAVF